jgi:hypothetical protein
MRASTTTAAAVAAFESFIDYAGLFPPARLSVADATAEYARERHGPHAWMLGRFIVPASRVAELGRNASVFPLSLIVDVRVSSPDSSAWFVGTQETLHTLSRLREQGARVESLEIPLPELRQRRETPDATIGQLGALLERYALRDLACSVELPRNERWRDDLPSFFGACSRAGLDAKLRCGGVTADRFPSVDEVASFVAAAAAARVRFKATAGLHHPIRHYAEDPGCTMHGFLNLLAAAVFASRTDQTGLREILKEEDPHAFAFEETSFRWNRLSSSVEELKRARTDVFASYGSCSFAEPVEDLMALDMLPAGEVR